MRDNAVGDVDGEVIGRIACASLRHENEVPGPVIRRAGLRDGSQGKREPAIVAQNKSFFIIVSPKRWRCW